MLRGPLARPMLLFSLPLIASGILQQSFNSVDVAVVGRFAGSQALAAVGSNGPVISLLVNMFIGLAVGVNVVIANYIGRNNSRGVGAAVTASAQLALIGGVALFALAMMASRPILEVLNTPADVLDQAVLYLRIYSAGMPFMVIYNFGAAILRSIGDTQRPFYSLVAAGIVNVGLNFLFVAGMGMDVDGVALATVLSQADGGAWGPGISNIVNAAIITGILIREQGDIHLDLRAVFGTRPDGSQLRKIAGIGVPAGLQGTVFAFSNVFILSAINTFGSAGPAGSATAINFEVYCYFVLNAFGQTAVAFTSQNYGAGRLDRCRRIFRISLLMAIVSTVALNVLLVWGRHGAIAIFTDDAEVARLAAERMLSVLLFQGIACYYEIAGASMRGLGFSMTPALITIFGTCVLRLVWVWCFPSSGGSFIRLMMIYPLSWALTDVAMAVAYTRIIRKLSLDRQ